MLSETTCPDTIGKSRLSAAKAGFAGKNLSILFIAFLLLQLTSLAQTKWYKYAGNPVLEKGAPGKWDVSHVRQPVVLWDGTKYNMWYSGMNGDVQAMGYAWSDDGIHWTKDIINNPVLERGAPGSWDSDFLAVESVLFDGTLYKMWYGAGGGTGLATSPDEIHWTKDTINNPVLTGTPGSWDAAFAAGANVIYDNSIYKMWYMGGGYNGNLGVVVLKLGYAESDSGITWAKHPDPVMEEGDYETWANDLWGPFVIYEDNNYTMWYVTSNTLSGASHGEQINYATSPDGLDWTKFNDNPVLSRGISPAWDYLSVWKPVIIKENNLYKMWYTGETNQEMGIGYAEDFSNLVHADSVIIEESYVIPNTDPLNILGRVISLEGHALTAKAMILSDDGSTQDSVELFDDGLNGDGTAGDGIYGGYLPVTNENEKNYTAGVKTIDQVTGFTRNGLDWNIIDRFTTAGPVVLDSIDISYSAFKYYRVKPYLHNKGNTATITNASVRLICNDPWVTSISSPVSYLLDISPGTIIKASSNANVYVDSTFPDYFNFKVEVMSDGWVYWTDSMHVIITGVEGEDLQPLTYKLEQNYPNPFNPVTTINYQIPELSFVTIKVYDVLGSEVATLVNEEKPIGNYEVEFNGTALPSGIYFYRIKVGDFIETKKMVLMK